MSRRRTTLIAIGAALAGAAVATAVGGQDQPVIPEPEKCVPGRTETPTLQADGSIVVVVGETSCP